MVFSYKKIVDTKIRVYYLYVIEEKEVIAISRPKGIPNRYHPPEFKLELVKEVLSGKSPRVVGQTHGVNEGVVRKWVSQYRQDGAAALENKRGIGSPVIRHGGKKDLSYVNRTPPDLHTGVTILLDAAHGLAEL